MRKYYIVAIEQTFIDGVYNEYMSQPEKCNDLNTAMSKYYKKLSDASADLGVNHTFMDIRVLNSEGGEEKRDTIGTYVLNAPAVNTEANTEA